MNSTIVNEAAHYFASFPVSSHYAYFGNIRFDTRQDGDFEFYNNTQDVYNSVLSHQPDPTLGFPNNQTGSDVFQMINRYLQVSQVPICGSKLFILVKRYPNTTDISNLVAKLRKYHITMTFMVSRTPSGGESSEILYDFATRTNGFCAFDDDDQIPVALQYVPACFNPYLLYAVNPEVSGKGSITLPMFNISAQDAYWFTMTIQDNEPTDVVQVSLLKATDAFGSTSQLGVTNGSNSGTRYGNHVGGYLFLSSGVYNMRLTYNYTDSRTRRLQIRGYVKNSAIDYWVPYDN